MLCPKGVSSQVLCTQCLGDAQVAGFYTGLTCSCHCSCHRAVVTAPALLECAQLVGTLPGLAPLAAFSQRVCGWRCGGQCLCFHPCNEPCHQQSLYTCFAPAWGLKRTQPSTRHPETQPPQSPMLGWHSLGTPMLLGWLTTAIWRPPAPLHHLHESPTRALGPHTSSRDCLHQAPNFPVNVLATRCSSCSTKAAKNGPTPAMPTAPTARMGGGHGQKSGKASCSLLHHIGC
jgi:hypothetical protein